MKHLNLKATEAQGAQVAQKNDGKSMTTTSKKQKSTMVTKHLTYKGWFGIHLAAGQALTFLVENGWNPAEKTLLQQFSVSELMVFEKNVTHLVHEKEFVDVNVEDVLKLIYTMAAKLERDKVTLRPGDMVFLQGNNHFTIERAAA